MSLKQITSVLAAWGLVLLVGAPALAQNLADMQLFAPADMGGFGGPRKPSEGIL